MTTHHIWGERGHSNSCLRLQRLMWLLVSHSYSHIGLFLSLTSQASCFFWLRCAFSGTRNSLLLHIIQSSAQNPFPSKDLLIVLSEIARVSIHLCSLLFFIFMISIITLWNLFICLLMLFLFPSRYKFITEGTLYFYFIDIFQLQSQVSHKHSININ